MSRRISHALLLLVLSGIFAGLAAEVQAQEMDDPMVSGILAFREGRYTDAATAFESAVTADPKNAEAHFLLARVFFETPIKDIKRAGKELDAALLIEPENVQFLVARMQQLRTPTTFFFVKRARETKRRELAGKILKLDSTNSFAHQELGEVYIRDFWRYRNVLMYPSLTFSEYKYRGRSTPDPLAGALQQQIDLFNESPQAQGALIDNDPSRDFVAGFLDPNSIFLADQFDIETLEDQGIPVTDLSERAIRAYDRAIGHLQAALDADPRQRTVYDDLMKIYSLKGEYDEALKMLAQMYVFFPEDAQLWTYLGFSHYHAGNMEAAAKSFETALKYMSSREKTAYSSLETILPENEKKQYEKDEAAYSARFWTSKDPRYLTPYNERKLEHYTRLTYADLLYGSPELDLRGWDTQRGQILVRYGPPHGDVVIVPRSTSGIQHSLNPIQGAYGDQNAVTSQTAVIGRDGSGFDMLEEANSFNIWDYGDFKFVFEDPFRNGEYRLFSPSAADLADGTLPWANDYTIKARETFRRMPESYEYKAPGRQIEVPFLVSSFKNFNSTMSDVYINYGIPVVDYDPSEDQINITANAGTFVVGENRDMLVERRRTIYGLKTNQIVQFKDSNLWLDTESVRVPPGEKEFSIEFETSGGGTVAVQRRAVRVEDYSGDDLLLSDILLAYHIDEAEGGKPLLPSDIVRNELSIQPAPWSVFSHEQPIYLYFEVYNLTRNNTGSADYEVEAVLAPKKKGSRVGNLVKGIFGGGDKGVSVRLPFKVAAENDGQYLILDAANQEPGLYTLVLRVKDRTTGKQKERHQDLFLE